MAEKEGYLLVINSGSATIKFKIFELINLKLVVVGIVERIGLKAAFFKISELITKRVISKNFPDGLKNHQEALEMILNHLNHWQKNLKIVGHRVVHGGVEFIDPTLIDEANLAALKKYNQLAPLHNPVNLACLETCLSLLPSAKNIAVFDTAFYKTLPVRAFRYALSEEYYQKFGVRRYGFHGISHQYAAERAAEILKIPFKKLKLISCHLGNGSSITATKFGEAVDTSMGFTPLEGLIMGTRSGDLDPTIPLYLQKRLNIGPTEMEEILNKKSGILGVFGLSSDFREVLSAAGEPVADYKPSREFSEKEKERAKLTLAMFVYRAVKYIGAYLLVLGGADALIFSGGIGERSPVVRNLILKEVKKVFPKIKSLVIPADEELMIARECKKLVMGKG